jgi:hypothetical protein
MTGRELIKKIIDEDGLDKEYDIVIKDDKKLKKAMNAKSLSEICTVSVCGDEIELVTEFPLAARKFGLSDKWEKYVWDGETVYFHAKKNEPSSFSISFGGSSTTMVSNAIIKYRDAMVEEMVKQICENNLKYPRWISWRIIHYKEGKSVHNLFA